MFLFTASPRLIDDFHSPVAAHCVVSCDAAIEAHFLKNYFGTIDQGTTSTRFIVFNYQSTRDRSAKPGSQLSMPSSDKTRESLTTCGDSARLAAKTASARKLPCHSALTSPAWSYAGCSRTLRRLAFRACRYLPPLEPYGRSEERRARHGRNDCQPYRAPTALKTLDWDEKLLAACCSSMFTPLRT